jgi:RHS repeat-associated protein
MWTREGLGRSFIYGYNVEGERVAIRDLQADTFRFTIRDLDNRVIREFIYENDAYSWDQDRVHANGKVIASVEVNGTRHYHVDHLGTSRIISDASGDRVVQNSYSPFGLLVLGDGEDRLQFAGHERDSGTLDYMHARFYSPLDGRFLSVDPERYSLADSQVFNKFSYVSNNPVRFVDAKGRFKTDANGNLVFRPIDGSILPLKRHPGYQFRVDRVVLFTDLGNPIEASTVLRTFKGSRAGEITRRSDGIVLVDNSSSNPAATNCHGRTFADGKYAIDNRFVDTILTEDGYKIQTEGPAEEEDVLVYRHKETRQIMHSVTVVEVDENGQVAKVETISGSDSRSRITTVGRAWPFNGYDVERYRREANDHSKEKSQ